MNVGEISSFIFILCGLKTHFLLVSLKTHIRLPCQNWQLSWQLKKNNVYTHRKTPASTLRELITLIRFKNIEMRRKWDHYVQLHKNKYVFLRRKLERK